MIKRIYYLMTLLICSALWNPVSGETYWTFDRNKGLVINANDDDPKQCQFSSDFKAGTNGSSAEGSYANLIDGDGTTFFTTAWNGTAPEPDNHPHWLQVDLKDQPQQRIIFTMGRRADSYGQSNRPTEIILYVSNDNERWTEIDTIKNLPTAEATYDYTSDMIDLGSTYRYLRFAVSSTYANSKVGNYPYFAIGEFQVYQAFESNSPLVALEYNYQKIKNERELFVAGTNPGSVDVKKLEELDHILLKAEQDIYEGNETSAATTKEALVNAYNAVKASIVDFKNGGYYYIINMSSSFTTNQPNVKKALYADLDSRLYWGDLDEKKGKFAFIIRKLEDGNYTIQNAVTSEYIKCATDENGNFTDATDVQVSLSKEPDARYEQVLKSLGYAQYNIYNTKNTRAYETQGHTNGTGIGGKICTWNTGVNATAAWCFKEITDEELIKSFSELGPKQLMAEKLEKAIKNTAASRSKAIDYTALITSGDQLASNAEAWGLSNLIDGNTETIFHSIWDEVMSTATTKGVGWHNLQVKLGKEISKMKFHFNGRDNADGWHDNPTHITLYGTNDDALGASTASADSLQWTEIVDMTQDEYGLPGNDNAVSYDSPIIDLNGSYKYLRFVVKHVSTMDGGNRSTSFAAPFITGVTFNLSEFQVYDGTPAETSEYYKVAGMKEACEAYDKLVADAREKIANLTVTEADIEAINAAAKAIDDLYVDRDAIDNKLAELNTKAKKLYDAVTSVSNRLISDASQLSSNSNCGWWADTVSFLIDGDKETYYHSFWDTEMQKSDLTNAEWEAFMEKTDGLKSHYTGSGYHNLQVKLKEPVKSFYFQYFGRDDSEWHDNPNDIQIFATNDDELGASTNNAEQDSWTAITELTEGFPEDVAVVETPYTSPVIDLGDSYKYIRFVIKNTTHAGKDPTRIFNSPDVTGITFSLSEFQMYPGNMSQNDIQYNYIPGMKDACDAMKAILDEAGKMGKHEMVTSEFNDKFEAAIAAVEALYADTTELAALAKTYRESYIAKSVVSNDNYGLGYVDSEEAIKAFANAVTEAKNGVSPVSPTKEQIDKAIAQMKEAFKTFMTHVGQLEPNKWYNIFGGSLYPYTQGQPVFLNSTSTGDQLHIGTYQLETSDPTSDPYAIWRLVPMEGYEPTGNAIGCYAIQNMGTGQYFGPYRGKGSEASPLMSHEKTPYNIYYYGNGKFKMQQVGVADPFDCLKTDRTNFIVLNYPADGNEQQSFIFKPIESDVVSISYYLNNSLNTMVLPWAVDGLTEINYGISEATVKTYAVKSLTTTEEGSRLELKEKSSFEAGEPFIIAVNDYKQCDNETKQPIYFTMPSTVTDTSAIVANGLIGTLEGMTVAAPGMGIFNYDAETTSWKLAASAANLFVNGRYAYLDPKKVVNEEGDADLVIETADQVTAVKPFIVTKATDKVNVYSIDGKLIKRNVKAAEAQKSLKKGIYIIGKKKVAVK